VHVHVRTPSDTPAEPFDLAAGSTGRLGQKKSFEGRHAGGQLE
jgi:hypothetical protein